MSPTSVPLLDLRRDPALDEELEAAFRRVLQSGQYILGPEVEAFERECASQLEVKHALGVSSGTDALLLALMVLGIGPGDEVLCPTYTFFATAEAIWRTGATPVFVDCLPCCYALDPVGAALRITPRTRAIVPAHLFGQCAHMNDLLETARERGLHVVEDAAQAIGARDRGRGAGTMGAFGCLSFFPSKNLGALGDAGLVVTGDDRLAARARVMRSHGAQPKYHHAVVGGNFRIDALQAALLRVKLPRLGEVTRARRANAALYASLLADLGLVRAPTECGDHVYNQYVVRVPGEGQRDRLRAFLAQRGVGTEVYYPVPMHQQECFAGLGGKAGDHPQAEAAARETLALPVFAGLRPDEVHFVARQVAEFCGQGAH